MVQRHGMEGQQQMGLLATQDGWGTSTADAVGTGRLRAKASTFSRSKSPTTERIHGWAFCCFQKACTSPGPKRSWFSAVPRPSKP